MISLEGIRYNLNRETVVIITMFNRSKVRLTLHLFRNDFDFHTV